jgi:[protein-PII] uridylyltransferase
MRLFQHCQLRNLKLSPQIRRLIATHWEDIDRPFRYAKTNRLIFQSILEKKGEVARILRLMHRAGLLGRYLPEFGALDCLVQHEFFHRYTADEHTLVCIEKLDQLIDTEDPKLQEYREIFQKLISSLKVTVPSFINYLKAVMICRVLKRNYPMPMTGGAL